MTLRRKEQYPIDAVLVHVRGNTNVSNRDLLYMEFDGDRVKIRSDRLLVFKRKGTKCVTCGIEGKFFAKEKHPKDKSWHFNLYAIKGNGEEVLMTKDHIKPKAKGGTDALYNYQPMCIECNAKKGDIMPKALPSRRKTKPELEKEVATLRSVMGGKDGAISRLTRENRDLLKELGERRKRVTYLQAETEILRTRIRQLMELMMNPVVVTDKTSGG